MWFRLEAIIREQLTSNIDFLNNGMAVGMAVGMVVAMAVVVAVGMVVAVVVVMVCSGHNV